MGNQESSPPVHVIQAEDGDGKNIWSKFPVDDKAGQMVDKVSTKSLRPLLLDVNAAIDRCSQDKRFQRTLFCYRALNVLFWLSIIIVAAMLLVFIIVTLHYDQPPLQWVQCLRSLYIVTVLEDPSLLQWQHCPSLIGLTCLIVFTFLCGLSSSFARYKLQQMVNNAIRPLLQEWNDWTDTGLVAIYVPSYVINSDFVKRVLIAPLYLWNTHLPRRISPTLRFYRKDQSKEGGDPINFIQKGHDLILHRTETHRSI